MTKQFLNSKASVVLAGGLLLLFGVSGSTADLSSWLGGSSNFRTCESPCMPGTESLMSQKEHGTSKTPVQNPLRWNCSWKTADHICNYNRHYAEHSGYWETTSFLSEVDTSDNGPMMTFYDSNSGKPLFKAPIGRSWKDFLTESRAHGWPSFRDEEVIWDNVRVLPNGETVSVDGTHLGHNLPDSKGRRYCINLVSVAGNSVDSSNRR